MKPLFGNRAAAELAILLRDPANIARAEKLLVEPHWTWPAPWSRFSMEEVATALEAVQ